MKNDDIEAAVRDAQLDLPEVEVRLIANYVGLSLDRWLVEHDRKVSESAWTRGRTDSIDLKLDGAGFRVVAKNADNPFTVRTCESAANE